MHDSTGYRGEPEGDSKYNAGSIEDGGDFKLLGDDDDTYDDDQFF